MRGLPGALPYQATYRDAYRMAYRRIKNYPRTAYQTECGSILPHDYWEANGYSTEAVYRWPREVNQERTEAIIRMTSTGKRSTETLPDPKSRDAGIRICNEAFPEQTRAPIAVSMTTQCEAYVLDMDQRYTALADAIGAFYHTQMVTSELHMRTDGYDNARSESSHHCPKPRQRAIANYVEIERIRTPHTTVSQHAEQVTTRHSRCHDVGIQRIGRSLTTVS